MVASLKRKRPNAISQEPETAEQRKSKCISKYYHAGVEVNRALKKAITFETQKLTKRLRHARDGENMDDSITRYEHELAALKAIDCDIFAKYSLDHTIQKDFKNLGNFLDVADPGPAPHRDASIEMKNVVARLIASNSVRTALTSSIMRLNLLAGLSSARKPTKVKQIRSEAPKRPHAGMGQADFQSSGSNKVLETSIPYATFDTEEDESSVDDNQEDARSNEQGSATANERITTDSTFLPSLKSGYLPAFDGSDDEAELKGLFPAQKKERKNRRGQRARRKILEAKHGNKANHIVKAREQAQLDYEQRVARRAAREIEKTGSNAIAIEEAEKNRRERREARLRPIHDSWALAKARNQLLKQAKPAGQKVVFEA